MSAYGRYLDQFTVHGRWKLDDASVADAATCADETGSNDLAYVEATGPLGTVASPIIGDTQAVSFAGDAHAIKASPTSALDPVADRTLLAWVYFDDASGADYIFSCFKDSSNYFHVFRNSGVIDARVVIGGVNHSVKSSAVISNNTWYLVGVHINGSSDRKVSVDGVDVTVPSTSTLGDTSVAVALGARSDVAGELNGRIADVAILKSISVAKTLKAYQLATIPGLARSTSRAFDRAINRSLS